MLPDAGGEDTRRGAGRRGVRRAAAGGAGAQRDRREGRAAADRRGGRGTCRAERGHPAARTRLRRGAGAGRRGAATPLQQAAVVQAVSVGRAGRGAVGLHRGRGPGRALAARHPRHRARRAGLGARTARRRTAALRRPGRGDRGGRQTAPRGTAVQRPDTHGAHAAGRRRGAPGDARGQGPPRGDTRRRLHRLRTRLHRTRTRHGRHARGAQRAAAAPGARREGRLGRRRHPAQSRGRRPARHADHRLAGPRRPAAAAAGRRDAAGVRLRRAGPRRRAPHGVAARQRTGRVRRRAVRADLPRGGRVGAHDAAHRRRGRCRTLAQPAFRRAAAPGRTPHPRRGDGAARRRRAAARPRTRHPVRSGAALLVRAARNAHPGGGDSGARHRSRGRGGVVALRALHRPLLAPDAVRAADRGRRRLRHAAGTPRLPRPDRTVTAAQPRGREQQEKETVSR
ncbi:hypothetical protein SBRY_50859 [Actinacidiphila bryophytorum]|uniref:Uncharacterized protein n=1 Tax=Actinacidiphila bryophytorum TaxID=1436133 RepID=A0A9W4H5N4_9ACTN|nr:hypothetical protein SBRY_50859 [Actinacidiphila bryophytorum]